MISFSFVVIAAMALIATTAVMAESNNIVKVSNKPMHSGRISPMIYGGFIELLDDLVPGMRAEMLNDRNFEGVQPAVYWSYYNGEPNFCDREWDKSDTWSYDKQNPFNSEQSAKLSAQNGKNASLTQSGLAVKMGMTYNFEGYFRADVPNLELKALLKTLNPDGTWLILGSTTLSTPSIQWVKQKHSITCFGTTDRAVFELQAIGSGSVWADKVSLMPKDNLKGWRTDVVQAVKDADPGIIRWGGSIVDPGGYKWKNGIGDCDLRTPFQVCPWGRLDSNDVGLDEFLQFCELIDVEPLICVSFSDGPQSAKDMIDYCNGGPDTEWGKRRIENGHQKPYGVKYWQVGNELGDEEYIKGCAAICKAIKDADSNAILLSSYPSPELLAAAGKYLDYICPHHYVPDLQADEDDINANIESIKNAALDHKMKIGVTEWNVTGGWWGLGRGKLMTLETALFTGRYLNLLQRYSNVVGLACRSNMTNSYGSGMIQTNPAGFYLTPSYYVMKLYAEHSKPIPMSVISAIEGVDISACTSEDGKQLAIFVVNTTSEPVEIQLDLSEYGNSIKTVSGEVVCDTQDRRQPELMNHFTAPDRVRAVDLPMTEKTIKLPALSVAAVEAN